jgi:hypothetical protein
VARGPKLIMEMRQPHSTITTGVRQPMLEAFEAEGIEIAMTTTCSQSENNRWGRTRRVLVRPSALVLKQKLGVPSSADAWQLGPSRLATGWR